MGLAPVEGDGVIADFVRGKIPAWQGLKEEDIEVKNVSGLGASRTFKVSVPNPKGKDGGGESIVPEAVAYHVRSLEAEGSNGDHSKEDHSMLELRNLTANRVFVAHGAGPRLVAEDGPPHQWSIQEWSGEAISGKFMGPGCAEEAEGVASAEKLFQDPKELRERVGALLGKAHTIPPEWADSFRESCGPFLLEDKFPTIGCLGVKIMQKQCLKGDLPPLMHERWGLAIDLLPNFTPALSRREVTLHGDFHCANILIQGSGVPEGQGNFRLFAIDFEFANVGRAEFDLGYAFVVNRALLNDAANKRAFVGGYLKVVSSLSSAKSSDDDPEFETEVENLLVDCELATLKAFPPNESVGVPETDGPTYEALLKRLAEHCSTVRAGSLTNPDDAQQAATLREELLNKGAAGLLREWHLKS